MGAFEHERLRDTHLLLFPQSQKTNTRDLHDLETHSRNITLGFTPTTETGDKDFIVLINEIQATIVLTNVLASEITGDRG